MTVAHPVLTAAEVTPPPLLSPASSTRDLRLDFIRGWVMLILVIVHSEFFSLRNLFVVAAASAILPSGFGDGRSLAGATLLHTGELALLWLMVRHKILYRWIPR